MKVDKCLKCGKCCYLTFFDKDGKIVETNIKCPYLTDDNLCSVYNDRPSWCMSANDMKKSGLLPNGCGYKIGE